MKRIVKGDLLRRIKLNRKRLRAAMYRYPLVFKQNPSWPGDWQGRCILALTSLYFAFSGYPKEQRSLLRQLKGIVDHLPKYLNEEGYFGDLVSGEFVNEQQVSGNSWYLRGIIEYYQITKDEAVLELIKKVVDRFIAKIASFYAHYPLSERHDGGVGGHEEGRIENGWMMSSDIGCAFIMLDAMSEAYYLLREESLKSVIADTIDAFRNIDFVALRCQTHATLSCARGILTFYRATGEKKYLELAQGIFDTYLQNGTTLDYSNINWFGRPDTWTEPCCIVDSFVLAGQLHEDTREERYVSLMNRIYQNAFRLAQRKNGGAGCNTCLRKDSPILRPFLYEAYFCCTMRFAEGLRFVKKYSASWKEDGLEILLPQEENMAICNGASVEITGDIYRDRTLSIRVKNAQKPFVVSVYLPSSLRGKVVYGDGEFDGDYFRFQAHQDCETRLIFSLEAHDEEGVNWVGDRLLVKRDCAHGDPAFDLAGETYYYVLDYSRMSSKRETMSTVQTL